jgi:hypothetical protein
VKVALLPPTDPAWSDFLEQVRHDFYQLPSYVSLEADRTGGTAVALYAVDGARRLLLPFIERPIQGSRIDAISPYGYPGPLIGGTDDIGFAETALDAAVPVMRQAGYVSLFVRCHPILNAAPPRRVGTLVHHGDTVAIDLTVSDEANWAQMRRAHRQDIERAIMNGHEVHIGAAQPNLPEFVRLYRATMRRVLAAPEYYFDDRYFESLADALGDRLQLALLSDAGAIAAAAMFVETDGIVEYHLMGVDEDFVSQAPAKLILHVARTWAKERGAGLLHLGGGVGGANDSLFHFKSGFSSLRYPFHTMRVVVDPVEYERLARERAPGREPSDLTGFFPAYRQPQNDPDHGAEATTVVGD